MRIQILPLNVSLKNLQKKIIKITNGEWPPYLGEYLPRNGIISDIIRKTFDCFNYEVVYGFFPWKRALFLVEKGQEWDAAAVWRKTPEREKNLTIGAPVLSIGYTFFYKKTNTKVKDINGEKILSLNDLLTQKLVVGYSRGYDYGGTFSEMMKKNKNNFQESDNEEALLRKIIGGRIDVAPISKEVGISLLQNKFMDKDQIQIDFTDFAFEMSDMYIIFSKRYSENDPVVVNFARYVQKFKVNNADLSGLKK